MAHYQEVDYCSEEVRSVASPAGGFRHGGGGGMQQQVVKETFQEVDRVPRAGHHGRHHHGHHGSGHMEMRETRLEEDFNTCTGEFHERKDTIVVRAD